MILKLQNYRNFPISAIFTTYCYNSFYIIVEYANKQNKKAKIIATSDYSEVDKSNKIGNQKFQIKKSADC